MGQIDGFRAGVEANTSELSLVFPRFSLADAVVDPIEEGEEIVEKSLCQRQR
jgi:hypothetical protein